MSAADQAGEVRGYAAAAPLYLAAGWASVLPLPARKKVWPPRGFTGYAGRVPSPTQIAAWAQRRPAGNVALRLPEGVVGLDLDLYKPAGAASFAALLAELGDLPPTWRSSSRDDGSGIRFFRVPVGVRWAERQAGDGIELIHATHRYAVVWPSVHPNGRTYGWHRPDGDYSGPIPRPTDLAWLPAPWGRRLTQLAEPPAAAPVPRLGVTHPAGGGYGAVSLAGAVAELAALGAGAGRNIALNRKAFHLGGLVAAGLLEEAEVRRQLYAAAVANGHVAKHGERQTLATIDSGLRAGAARPRRTA